MSFANNSYQLFPEIEPYDVGRIALDNIHTMAYEQSGNPDGVPVLFIHGGPGGGCAPHNRQFFDPDHYRIILFDQRGAGQSTPHGELQDNTTDNLLADIETLREHLGIEKWLIFGGSWGATLGLHYGENYPDRCTGFILRGIYLCREMDADWFFYVVCHLFPEAWHQFSDFIPEAERGDLLQAYHSRIHDPDPAVHQPAAYHFNRYACTLLTLVQDHDIIDEMIHEEGALESARIQTHYFINEMFIGKDALLHNLHKVAHLPAIVIHGRYDVTCPVVSSFELAQNWPEAELHIIEAAGHRSSEGNTKEMLVYATEAFKD